MDNSILFAILAALLAAGLVYAQTAVRSAAAPETIAAPTARAPRPRMGAAAQRNENVAVYQIDNNAIKEANIRLGSRTTLVPSAPVEASYFATEHGQAASETLAPTAAALARRILRIASGRRLQRAHLGPRVRLGFRIEELGPDSHFPINRARNSFRYGGMLSRHARGGWHILTLGADLIRFQLNGIETNNQRGYLQFTNNFGRGSIENLRLGTPSTYEISIGDLNRGYASPTFPLASCADRSAGGRSGKPESRI